MNLTTIWTSPARRVLALLIAGWAFTPAATAGEKMSDPAALKVQVNTPFAGSILIEDRARETLVERLQDVFARAGFEHPVQELRPFEDPAKAPYLLTIDLMEWRVSRIGNVECTFAASLQTPQGKRDFGLYTNTAPGAVVGPGRWGLRWAFDESVDGALRELGADILKAGLLPGGRPAVARINSAGARAET